MSIYSIISFSAADFHFFSSSHIACFATIYTPVQVCLSDQSPLVGSNDDAATATATATPTAMIALYFLCHCLFALPHSIHSLHSKNKSFRLVWAQRKKGKSLEPLVA